MEENSPQVENSKEKVDENEVSGNNENEQNPEEPENGENSNKENNAETSNQENDENFNEENHENAEETNEEDQHNNENIETLNEEEKNPNEEQKDNENAETPNEEEQANENNENPNEEENNNEKKENTNEEQQNNENAETANEEQNNENPNEEEDNNENAKNTNEEQQNNENNESTNEEQNHENVENPNEEQTNENNENPNEEQQNNENAETPNEEQNNENVENPNEEENNENIEQKENDEQPKTQEDGIDGQQEDNENDEFGGGSQPLEFKPREPSESPLSQTISPRSPNADTLFASPRRKTLNLNQTCPAETLSCISLTSPLLSRPRGSRPSPYKRKRPVTCRSMSIYTSPVYRTYESSSNDIQKLKEKAKKEEPLNGVTVEQFQELLYVLNQERKNFAKEKRFKDGLKCNHTINYVNQWYLKAQKLEIQTNKQEEFNEAKAEFTSDLAKFDAESKALEKELIEKQKNFRNVLQSNHSKERDEFEQRWNGDKKQRIYNHSTGYLINLRYKLSFLLIQNRFAEAESCQKAIAERTKYEMQEHHEIMQHDFDESLKQLEDRQANELQTYDENCQLQLEKLRHDREKLRRSYLNRQMKLNAKEEIVTNPDKVWIHSQQARLTEAARTSKRTPLSPSTKMTRTDEMRSEEAVSLELPPLDNRRKTQKKAKVVSEE